MVVTAAALQFRAQRYGRWSPCDAYNVTDTIRASCSKEASIRHWLVVVRCSSGMCLRRQWLHLPRAHISSNIIRIHLHTCSFLHSLAPSASGGSTGCQLSRYSYQGEHLDICRTARGSAAAHRVLYQGLALHQ